MDMFANGVRVSGDPNDSDATLEAATPANIKHIRGTILPMPLQIKRSRQGDLSPRFKRTLFGAVNL